MKARKQTLLEKAQAVQVKPSIQSIPVDAELLELALAALSGTVNAKQIGVAIGRNPTDFQISNWTYKIISVAVRCGQLTFTVN